MAKNVNDNKNSGNGFVFCRNCGREIGRVDQDCQSFSIYNSPLTVWEATRFICKCNKPYWFKPQDLPKDSGEDFRFKVINGQGKIYGKSKVSKGKAKKTCPATGEVVGDKNAAR